MHDVQIQQLDTIAQEFETLITGVTLPTRFQADALASIEWSKSLSAIAASIDIQLTVDRTHPERIAQTHLCYNFVDNTLNTPWGGVNSTAVAVVEALLPQAFSLAATHVTDYWGARCVWSNPLNSAPTEWTDLDRRLTQAKRLGMTPVLLLGMSPAWMKGQPQADGSTKLATSSAGTKRYRVLDNMVTTKWVILVRAIAARYGNPNTYNVRTFSVWNELAGYFNPTTNDYDMGLNAGNPTKPTATHGFSYFYEVTRKAVLDEFTAHGWDTTGLQFGGCYPHLDHYGTPSQVAGGSGNVSKTLYGAWGVLDDRLLKAIQRFVSLVPSGHLNFLTVDGKNAVQSGTELGADEFVRSDFFGDATTTLRSLFPTLPIWWTEWYSVPDVSNPLKDDLAFRASLATYSLVRFIESGAAAVLNWGGCGDGMASSLADTAGVEWYARTDLATGGTPLPMFDSFKAVTQFFAPGTELYHVLLTPDDNRIKVLASDTHKVIINRTPDALVIDNEGAWLTLAGYEVKIL